MPGRPRSLRQIPPDADGSPHTRSVAPFRWRRSPTNTPPARCPIGLIRTGARVVILRYSAAPRLSSPASLICHPSMCRCSATTETTTIRRGDRRDRRLRDRPRPPPQPHPILPPPSPLATTDYASVGCRSLTVPSLPRIDEIARSDRVPSGGRSDPRANWTVVPGSRRPPQPPPK